MKYLLASIFIIITHCGKDLNLNDNGIDYY